jgi:nucleolar protein 56
MHAYIITTLIGTIAVNSDNKILSFKPFNKDPITIAEKYKRAQTELIEEERSVMNELKAKGYEDLIFATKKPGVKAEPGNPAFQFVAQNLAKLAVEQGVVKSEAELNRLLTQIGIELTKLKLRKAVERDKLVIQTVRAIEEVERAINMMVERLREAYGLHFPEMDKAISSHVEYARIVKDYGLRVNIKEPELAKLAKGSVGMEMTQEDMQPLQALATQILTLYDLKEKLTIYLEKLLKGVAPNLSALAEPMLAAKLISAAGGLEKLAKMASSTIQLLGAEKALFRHLRGKGRPPKYGLLYVHPLIQQAPPKLRGRVARTLASKLAIAVRIDHYTKEDRSKKLKRELEEKIKGILR